MSAVATIAPGTHIGAVHLTVQDLERAAQFYEHRLGLASHGAAPGVARLGAGGPDLLVLHHRPDARRVRGTTGLYHFAVLVPSRTALARSLKRLIDTGTPLDGASDHLVSEALYLHDPEGNGIEIYRDRPRDQWHTDHGQIRMALDPLDLEGLLAEPGAHATPWSGLEPATTMGHVHLRVADVEVAEQFYVGVLGFETRQRFGEAALFVAAGGYHHHLGFNTWASLGAPPPPADAAGLRSFVVTLPDPDELERITRRARAAGLDVEARERGARLHDPFSHRVELEVV